MGSITRLIDRSRIVKYWHCPRARFYGYELDGKGIVKSSTSLPLFTGISVHDSLATIAQFHKDGAEVPIDEIAKIAFDTMKQELMQAIEGEVGAHDFAIEQATLVEGMIRGFYKHTWPILMDMYPGIIAIETEMEYDLGDGMKFMAKPDLIVEDKNGELVYLEYKTTSSKKQEWIDSWNTAVQLHSSIKAAEATLGKAPSQVQIVGLYKGYCLEPSTPILTSDLRWEQVGSLKVGDKLAAFEEESGNNRSGGKALREWREATVTRTGFAELPCYKISLEDGTSFVCTANHKWLTAREFQGMGSAQWTETENLTKKSRIVKLIQPWNGKEFDPYDAGYLAAAFDGEGSLSSMQFDSSNKAYYSLGLTFTQNNNQMLSHVKELLAKYHITTSENDRTVPRDAQTLQIYGKIKLLSLLGKIRPKRLLPKLDFNKLGMIKDLPIRPVKVIAKEFVGLREVVTLETSTGTLIANGFASHNSSYGKQSSPFCYAYKKSGNPPFTQDLISYEWKAGLKRYPVWELEGGVKKWVDDMPFEVLANQFPMSLPIYVNEELVDSFFKQTKKKETEIEVASKLINESPEDNEDLLNKVFPQYFDKCKPSFGYACEFAKICHGSVTNPLEEGYQVREAHHKAEEEQFNDS